MEPCSEPWILNPHHSTLNSQAIRVINITTGYTSTLAGRIGNVGNLDGKFIVIPSNDPNIIDPPQAAFASPSGIDFFDRFAIVADSGNFKIRRLDISTGEVGAFMQTHVIPFRG